MLMPTTIDFIKPLFDLRAPTCSLEDKLLRRLFVALETLLRLDASPSIIANGGAICFYGNLA